MRVFLFSILLLQSIQIFGQSNIVRSYNYNASNRQKPLIVYFSGDGGFNTFSNALCENLAKSGYEVFAVNSNAYFKKKKTPAETASFLEVNVRKLLKEREHSNIVLLGYSFGADVMPFIYNNASALTVQATTKIILLAPSPTTDFEIHLLDMLNMNGTYNMDVAAEINKIKTIPLHIVTGSKAEFPSFKIKNKNALITIVNGNTHFNKNPEAILPIIYKALSK